MKIKLFIIGLAILLMSIKCAEKPLYFSFENNSDRNVVFSCVKNSDTLNNIISKKFFHDSSFKLLNKQIFKKDTLIESDLNFYQSKDKNFYTFYFLRVLKYDSIKNSYVFSKRYDSININKKHILVGEDCLNSITYTKDKIFFRFQKNN